MSDLPAIFNFKAKTIANKFFILNKTNLDNVFNVIVVIPNLVRWADKNADLEVSLGTESWEAMPFYRLILSIEDFRKIRPKWICVITKFPPF